MIAFTKRNILLYFRDKTSVFFSLLAVFILVALYVLFLGDLTANGLPDFPAKQSLLNAWFLAGILSVTSMTTTLAAFGILVEDKANKRFMDFYVSPITRAKLIGGYIGSALIIGILMCFITLFIANVFFLFSGESSITFFELLLCFGIIVLAVLSSSAMILTLVSFFNTSNAFAAASTVIGTLLGFLTGIYIPIGSLPDYLQTVIKLFPVSHSAALFRQILMESAMHEAFAQASSGTKEAFGLNMGVYYELNGDKIQSKWSVYYLISITIVFFLISLALLRRKSK